MIFQFLRSQKCNPVAQITEVDFRSMDEWLAWWDRNHNSVRPQVTAIAEFTHRHGLWEPLTQRFFASEAIAWSPDNLRESGLTEGINSRMRAVLYTLDRLVGHIDRGNLKIYAAEAVTDLALQMRGRFPKFLGSEYTDSPEVAEALFPIPNEDLTQLSFKDAAFDVVMTNEVLEHVPFLDRALSEMARVLKPGGWHIGTCPFRCMDQASLVRTVIEDSQLVHRLPPEWHGDPMGTGGSLVFEIPGWDILDRATAAGFRQGFWKFIQSEKFGIAADHVGGVFVLCLQK